MCLLKVTILNIERLRNSGSVSGGDKRYRCIFSPKRLWSLTCSLFNGPMGDTEVKWLGLHADDCNLMQSLRMSGIKTSSLHIPSCRAQGHIYLCYREIKNNC
jgi:hypothetical protein